MRKQIYDNCRWRWVVVAFVFAVAAGQQEEIITGDVANSQLRNATSLEVVNSTANGDGVTQVVEATTVDVKNTSLESNTSTKVNASSSGTIEIRTIAKKTSEKNESLSEEAEFEEDDKNAPKAVDENRAKLFIFATSSTTTKFKLAVVRSTTPYTCIQTAATTACLGRKRRALSLVRLGQQLQLRLRQPSGQGLDGSIDSIDSGDISNDIEVQGARAPRKFLTVWTTSFSTKTITSYLVDRGVSVSISAMCTLAGGNGIPGCG